MQSPSRLFHAARVLLPQAQRLLWAWIPSPFSFLSFFCFAKIGFPFCRCSHVRPVNSRPCHISPCRTQSNLKTSPISSLYNMIFSTKPRGAPTIQNLNQNTSQPSYLLIHEGVPRWLEIASPTRPHPSRSHDLTTAHREPRPNLIPSPFISSIKATRRDMNKGGSL